MRMTIFKSRTDICLNYELHKEAWDVKEQALSGKHKDRGFVLNLTNQYRLRALGIYQQLIQRGIACDVNSIRQKLTGTESVENSAEPTLLSLFDRIIARKASLLGRNNSGPTIQKYKRCKNHLAAYILEYYKAKDGTQKAN